VVDGLDPTERALAGEGIMAGLVIDENTPDYERGDFLIRSIHGGDRESGVLVVGERVRVGQTMRFHVRDAGSADEDLRAMLAAAGDAQAGLVFSCTGRGTQMFERPNHDAELVAEITGGRCAGMFCAGEIGPVGSRSFLHSFTASIALFR